MMTLAARLCALCAVSVLMQMMVGESMAGDGLRLIGGLLMLHLVLDGGAELAQSLSAQQNLAGIFDTLMK